MRFPLTELCSRRAALTAFTTTCLLAYRQPAVALVDGIPLYAPGEGILLPEAGFEVFLPRIEMLRDQALPALKQAVVDNDWRRAAELASADNLKRQMSDFGRIAALLGDDAYTVLALKAQYGAAAKRLQQALVAASVSQSDAQQCIADMDAKTTEVINLVPKVVVDQVRQREKMLANALDSEAQATGAQLAPSPSMPSPSTEPPSTGLGGLLTTPDSAGKKVCGVDIRC